MRDQDETEDALAARVASALDHTGDQDAGNADISDAMLAEAVRTWRISSDFNRQTAGLVLGIPWRTIERIEQGRGFPYPRLLLIAIQLIKPPA